MVTFLPKVCLCEIYIQPHKCCLGDAQRSVCESIYPAAELVGYRYILVLQATRTLDVVGCTIAYGKVG